MNAVETTRPVEAPGPMVRARSWISGNLRERATLLFALIVLGDDRLVERVVIA